MHSGHHKGWGEEGVVRERKREGQRREDRTRRGKYAHSSVHTGWCVDPVSSRTVGAQDLPNILKRATLKSAPRRSLIYIAATSRCGYDNFRKEFDVVAVYIFPEVPRRNPSTSDKRKKGERARFWLADRSDGRARRGLARGGFISVFHRRATIQRHRLC
jgi:hypothetical protein